MNFWNRNGITNDMGYGYRQVIRERWQRRIRLLKRLTMVVLGSMLYLNLWAQLEQLKKVDVQVINSDRELNACITRYWENQND